MLMTIQQSYSVEGLRSTPLFRDASPETLEQFSRVCLVQRVPSSTELIGGGERPGFVHVILEGAVEFFSIEAGREAMLCTVRDGLAVGLDALLSSDEPVHGARTLSTARLLAIPGSALIPALSKDPGLAFSAAVIASTLSTRLAKELAEQKLRTSIERLAHWLLRVQRHYGGAERFELPYSKRTLALRLGMTPESLSRNFAQIEKSGCKVDGPYVSVTDLPKLESLARV
ncbi:helix-turn-helix domain-containing protein [Alsobacter metallidurans]|uniref:helix-turn-helix domain-containing protein n=1 Tax=Alsobacter metallidurans TaxID=340221 RepID=UPI00166E1748|nr:helix-turn-helix domain-containing protein [Alsobacter metallidurans]